MSEICAGDEPAVTEALAELDQTGIEELIQQALHPSVPVGVLFAALDRYTALTRMDGNDPVAVQENPGPEVPHPTPAPPDDDAESGPPGAE